MTPNLNHEDAAHLLNIIRGEQVQSSLMSALAKQHAEQVTKLVLEAKSAHKAMGELYKHLCQKISEATKDGAEKAVAQFSLDANSAALKDAKNISEDLKRSSDLLSEAEEMNDEKLPMSLANQVHQGFLTWTRIRGTNQRDGIS